MSDAKYSDIRHLILIEKCLWIASYFDICHLTSVIWFGGGSDQAKRAIRTGQLSALPRVHFRPIDVMVYHGS